MPEFFQESKREESNQKNEGQKPLNKNSLEDDTRMNMRIPIIVLIALIGSFFMGKRTSAYEKSFEKTPAGLIEVKTIPPAKLLVTKGQGNYFNQSGSLFTKLFDYIRKNDVAMTVPVEAEIEQASMRFYVGGMDTIKQLQDQGDVFVTTLPARKVASIGVRGSYSARNYADAKKTLEDWLSAHPQYEPVGGAYAVFWNAPYVPWFLKHFEVHVQIEETEAD
jgi:hypothetical protein